MAEATALFDVLYTPLLYRTKKTKAWQEGKLIYTLANGRAALYDENGRKLDAAFVSQAKVQIGEELEMDRNLVLVDAATASLEKPVHTPPSSASSAAAVPQRRRGLAATGRGRRGFRTPRVVAPPAAKPPEPPEPPAFGAGSVVTKVGRAFSPEKDPDEMMDETIRPSEGATRRVLPLVNANVQNVAALPTGGSRWASWEAASKVALDSDSDDNGGPAKAPAAENAAPRAQVPQRAARGKAGSRETAAKPAGGRASAREAPATGPAPALKHNPNPSAQNLHYPAPDELPSARRHRLSRTVAIPTTLPSAAAYVQILGSALHEHVQLQLCAHAQDLYKALERGRRPRGRHFYSECQIESLDFGKAASARERRFVVHLGRSEPSGEYNRDDMWLVAEKATFRDPLLARSTFHGPTAAHELELAPLGGPGAGTRLQRLLDAGEPVHALRVLSSGMELQLLQLLEDSRALSGVPLADALARQPQAPAAPARQYVTLENVAAYRAQISETISTYRLNPQQAVLLTRAAESFLSNSPAKGPITLCHGVFGSGKSFLVAVMVVFFAECDRLGLLEPQTDGDGPNRKTRRFTVVLASMSNVAVDRMLLNLLELGFTAWRRAGNVKKMAKAVLPYVLRADGTPAAAAQREQQLQSLRDMLRHESLSTDEREAVEAALERFKSSGSDEGAARILGVTCAASGGELLDSVTADLMVLDECSQMTEPLALLPIVRFAPARLVLVGDPLQLPPTLTTPFSGPSGARGLERTLFERLAAAGLEPVVLVKQYRCHPRIGSVASRLFYRGQLEHGVSSEMRAPVLPGFGPLSFISVTPGPASTERSAGGANSASWANDGEARLVARIVRGALAAGLDGSQIGVVCLYRAQADLVRDALCGSADESGIVVSTVDAFQGAERDVIIVSTVRTAAVGFIDDPRRVNVAITRAKTHLLVVGCESLLVRSPLWEQILHEHVFFDEPSGRLTERGALALLDG